MALEFLVKLLYLLGVVGFVWGLRLLSSPDTARKGNILAGIGMGMAIVAALIDPAASGANNYWLIFGGMAVGAIIGYLAAVKVKMTAMPEMVSIFNGFGGATAILLAMAELIHFYDGSAAKNGGEFGILLATLLIGSVTFTGSMLAWGKLNGTIKDKHVTLPAHSTINLIFLVVIIALSVYMYMQGVAGGLTLAIIMMVISLIYGVSFVAPIGGADMPVVISLLNSFSGLSAAAAGFVYGSQVMIVGGILVGAAGTILTVLMCEAMNRSLLNVLIGGFGGGGAGAAKGAQGDQVAKEVSVSDAAINLFYSQNVMIVPGYGLAVAQAQKVVKEVDDLLSKNGVNVTYGIHPVAGRMPGHMNVLLAEADVPYPKLLDLEDANSQLKDCDVVVIVGANDVVNPAAEDDPGSPIYGMPVLQVWNAKNTIVLKRSMSAGYAGIQNQLFFNDNNRMLFGDAKDSLQKVAAELKNM